MFIGKTLCKMAAYGLTSGEHFVEICLNKMLMRDPG